MWRQTSRIERTPGPGRQSYFSSGIALQRSTACFSRLPKGKSRSAAGPPAGEVDGELFAESGEHAVAGFDVDVTERRLVDGLAGDLGDLGEERGGGEDGGGDESHYAPPSFLRVKGLAKAAGGLWPRTSEA